MRERAAGVVLPILMGAMSALVTAGVAGGLLVQHEHAAHRALVERRTSDLRDLEARIDALAVKQSEREQAITMLDRKIADASARLQHAEAVTAKATCDSTNARLDAEVTLDRVQCFEAIAQYSVCEAKAAKDEAGDTLLGCALGIGATFLTGGAGVGLAAAGCGAGYAVGAADDACGEKPVCAVDAAVIEPVVLAAHNLTTRPLCGMVTE